MKKKFVPTFFLFAAGILLCQCSCNENNSTVNKNTTAIQSGRALLQDGDLVMRSDDDLESLTLQNFSDSDRTYSHAGIAFEEQGQYVVYHSMAGSENPSGLMRKDPFDSFVNPAKKTGFGIFRYQLLENEKEKLHVMMKEHVLHKTPFDASFSLRTDDSLYCSEVIYKVLKASTGNRVVLPSSTLINFQPKILGHKYKNIFLKQYEYISLDNLYLNPFCKEITRITYQP